MGTDRVLLAGLLRDARGWLIVVLQHRIEIPSLLVVKNICGVFCNRLTPPFDRQLRKSMRMQFTLLNLQWVACVMTTWFEDEDCICDVALSQLLAKNLP